jgi:outer membrane scaffolding protein for murein synthesis (MipA/OmpV family)
MSSPNKVLASLLLASCLATTPVFGADIARELRVNADENAAPDNFLEFGLGAVAGTGPSLTEDEPEFAGLTFVVAASYNYGGFFVDVAGETSEPLLFGYNAYNTDNWSFDVVLANTGDGISDDTDDRFKDIDEREASTMFGGRATGYLGENIVQFSLKHDVSGKSKGITASALIGRNWQYRNWNFHGLLGLSYANDKFSNYYLGVSEEESLRTDFEAYEASAMLNANASIGVTYPISEDWIFRATAVAHTTNGTKDNPLFKTTRDGVIAVGASISYVF